MSNQPMEVEIINLSDDELNNGDQTRISENIEPKESHIRKTADLKWFDDYPWLSTEYMLMEIHCYIVEF
ncbi:2848_t:CDS:1, partial [Entrophospora sp. SA101]